MKIVFTGGPSAGKTSIVEILYKANINGTLVIPEAASILFKGGFPRQADDHSVKCQQRAIYHVQKELEALVSQEDKSKLRICDRGTLDGLAYWRGDETSFFANIESSMDQELLRYDWVIHLDTAVRSSYKSSAVRIEALDEALLLNDKVKHAWRMHSKRVIVPNNSSFLNKIERTVKVVEMIVAGHSLEEILSIDILKDR